MTDYINRRDSIRDFERWRKSGPLLECQSCGEIYSRLGGNAGKLWNYCPNCVAKMDGGRKCKQRNVIAVDAYMSIMTAGRRFLSRDQILSG